MCTSPNKLEIDPPEFTSLEVKTRKLSGNYFDNNSHLVTHIHHHVLHNFDTTTSCGWCKIHVSKSKSSHIP